MKNLLLLRRIFLVIIGIPVVSFLLFWGYIYAFTTFYTFLGYHVGNGARFADGIAAIAVEKHDINECMKITYAFEIMGPTVRELQGNCIFEAARLSKDPRVCIRLMPSPYGISCIGQVWGDVDHDGDCFDKRDVKDLSDRQLECISVSGTVERTFDCENISMPSLKDQCFAMRGIRDADSKLCSLVSNETYRSICELKIELQKKYPGIQELR